MEAAVPSMQIYYFGFFMMSLQFSGQTVFQALGKAKFAILVEEYIGLMKFIPNPATEDKMQI